MPTPLRPLLAAVAVAAVVTTGAACEPPGGPGPTTTTTTTTRPPPPPVDVVVLPLDGGRLESTGTAAVTVGLASRDGGTITSAEDRQGAPDGAVRLPAHDATAPAPRAAVRVTNAGAGDALDPGTRRFSFGADVRLDATSESGAAGGIDNGDNVVQRGLFDDVVQYKLQVDHRQPSCRVKGRAGEVMVTSTVTLDADRWYRLLCTRSGTTVSLTVTSWSPGGTPTDTVTRGEGATGSMTPAAPTVPLSAGGKLLATGAVAGSTDQLNGLLDRVVLRVG